MPNRPEDPKTTVIDDSASGITYSTGWEGRTNANDGYFNGTAHQTTEADEFFTLP